MKKKEFPSRCKKAFIAASLIILFPVALLAAAVEVTAPTLDMSDAAIKRGEEIFQSSCQGCHSLKYSGYTAKISAKDAQKIFGDVPPDLNLMAKARGGGSKGAAYIYSLLVGYNDTPEKNSVFPNITMPPPFFRDDPELARKTMDVSAFLDYAADPSGRERRGLGIYVLGYMVILTMLLYALNRRTWRSMSSEKI